MVGQKVEDRVGRGCLGLAAYIPTERGCKTINVDKYDGLGNLRFPPGEACREVRRLDLLFRPQEEIEVEQGCSRGMVLSPVRLVPRSTVQKAYWPGPRACSFSAVHATLRYWVPCNNTPGRRIACNPVLHAIVGKRGGSRADGREAWRPPAADDRLLIGA